MRLAFLPPAAPILFALAAALPVGAAAEGPYLKALGGASFLLDQTARRAGGGAAEASFDAGYGFGLAAGWEFTPNLAAEIEYLYRTGDAGSFAPGGFGAGGDLASVIVSGHLLYTLDGWEAPGGVGRLRPFGGVGVGIVQEVDFDISGGAAAGEYSDSGAIALQARAGLRWDIDANWGLGLEARYLNAGSPTLKRSGGGESLKVRYETIDAFVSLSYRF
ncbi:MAG: outer membrane beta-barrel protein [Pikeienuella sp.]|uniref:outer membrane beta-barrel protein n=1 Tax=Pikeienuella sp. TaxID=2831957 RepID=UPI00391D97D1